MSVAIETEHSGTCFKVNLHRIAILMYFYILIYLKQDSFLGWTVAIQYLKHKACIMLVVFSDVQISFLWFWSLYFCELGLNKEADSIKKYLKFHTLFLYLKYIFIITLLLLLLKFVQVRKGLKKSREVIPQKSRKEVTKRLLWTTKRRTKVVSIARGITRVCLTRCESSLCYPHNRLPPIPDYTE